MVAVVGAEQQHPAGRKLGARPAQERQPLLVLDKNGDGELDRKEVRGLSDAAGSGLPPLVAE